LVANVLRRKLRRDWAEIEEALANAAVLLPAPRALTYATHRAAITICLEFCGFRRARSTLSPRA